MAVTEGKVFPGDRMTSRQRLLAAYRGLPVDRIPYWAKVCNPNWRNGQPEHIRKLSERELLDYIHADGLFHMPRFLARRPGRATIETHEADHVRHEVFHTPDGDLTSTWRQDPATRSWHPFEFPVKSREDIARCRWLYHDERFTVDEKSLTEARNIRRGIGERGMLKDHWGTTPLMHLVEHIIGPVQTTYFLADYGEEMDELIFLMHESNLRYVRELSALTPADMVVSVENTSTTLISPEQFERYCLPHLCDVGRAIGAAGRMHELHMCGLLLALLERIDTIPAASIEAFTSPTLGNTRLVDGRKLAPSKTLVGGTNATVWIRPTAEICRAIERDLEECTDHRRIVLTTAGEAPQACSAETFRAVGQWLGTVPVRF